MAEKVAAETIAMIAFVLVSIIFLIWLFAQFQEFALFFGVRLSDTVGTDIAGLITSAGGVSGKVIKEYEIEKSGSTKPVCYKLFFNNNLTCVQSIWSVEINTTDCFPIPSIDFTNNLPRNLVERTGVTDINLRFEKEPSTFDKNTLEYKNVKVSVDKIGGGLPCSA